jgi:hypothetical protein
VSLGLLDEPAPCPFTSRGVGGLQWSAEAVVEGALPGFGGVARGLGVLPYHPLDVLNLQAHGAGQFAQPVRGAQLGVRVRQPDPLGFRGLAHQAVD